MLISWNYGLCPGDSDLITTELRLVWTTGGHRSSVGPKLPYTLEKVFINVCVWAVGASAIHNLWLSEPTPATMLGYNISRSSQSLFIIYFLKLLFFYQYLDVICLMTKQVCHYVLCGHKKHLSQGVPMLLYRYLYKHPYFHFTFTAYIFFCNQHRATK